MRRHGRAASASALALGLALLLIPALAEACPACASRDGSGTGLLVLLGSMILLPSVVFSVVLVVLRRSEHEL